MSDQFEASRGRLFVDPWAARDSYIEILLGRPERDFMAEYGVQGLNAQAVAEAIGLLEIQKSTMLMYTSCGWFFNDLAGIETIFVLRHAGMVVELARKYTGRDLEPELLGRLQRAVSNRDGMTGRDIYVAEVAPFFGD
jgi:alpha-amylase/alpha-mannosidase (GH57 family)